MNAQILSVAPDPCRAPVLLKEGTRLLEPHVYRTDVAASRPWSRTTAATAGPRCGRSRA
ncbi:hypothetical protein HH297_15675 [Xanthomonas sp. Kuri4-3]